MFSKEFLVEYRSQLDVVTSKMSNAISELEAASKKLAELYIVSNSGYAIEYAEIVRKQANGVLQTYKQMSFHE